MTLKQRTQNPTTGDIVQLNLVVYNANNRANVHAVEGVDIYFLDPHERTESNPHGRRLVETIDPSQVQLVEEGRYQVDVNLVSPRYTIGHYLDVWRVTYEQYGPTAEITNPWQVYPNLWYTTPIPIVYDFQFDFRPNRLPKGSKRYLAIDIVPNVPRGSDLERYYANLAIANPVKISIEMECVPCMPCEQDLRLIADAVDVSLVERGHAYYFLDTEALDMEKGIYNVWFSMNFGESTYIGEKQQLQVF